MKLGKLPPGTKKESYSEREEISQRPNVRSIGQRKTQRGWDILPKVRTRTNPKGGKRGEKNPMKRRE